MALPDKLKSVFHTLFHRKRNANAEAENKGQSQGQNQSENQHPSPKEQHQEEEERYEHDDDTYGGLSEVAAPEPVEPGPPHRPSLEGRLSESRRHSDH